MVCVAHIGETAHAVLRCETTGVIDATFDRCAYINFNDQYLCVALDSIGRGPLNLVYSSNVSRLPEHMQPGVVVSCSPSNKSLQMQGHSNDTIAQFSQAVVCNNNITSVTDCWHASGRNRRELHKLLKPSTGLFGAVMENHHELRDCVAASLHRFTAPILHELQVWLLAATTSDKPSLAPDVSIGRLLGAGPGLTPSGDDLLAGVLLSLRYTGFDAAAEQLGAMLLRDAAQRTNAISVNMLQEAAHGRAGEWAWEVVVMYGSAHGFDTVSMARILSRMGESSGWDFLTGVVMVFDALANPITNGTQIHG
jgi:hypothetical protein